jgi:Zn-finger nucleic acid-binding protein
LSYNITNTMICPNDKTEMRAVAVMSHYDMPVIIDQCPSCGGIWFDKSELYIAKQGEAEKVEVFDPVLLSAHSAFAESPLFCPRDKTELIRYTDKFFPKDIVLVQCSHCGGIWLNRGDFTKFQTERQELQQKRVSNSARDASFEAQLKQILEANRTENTAGSLENLSRFLNMPVENIGLSADDSATEPSQTNRAMNIIMNMLSLVLGVITKGRFL